MGKPDRHGIIYRPDTTADWNWLYTINVAHDITLDKLLGDPNSSARHVIDGSSNCIFYPDKRVGDRAKQYVPGLLDEQFDGIGSIICRDISLARDSRKYMQAVFSVTTYGQQICTEGDTEAISKIKSLILPCFETRLRLELSLLYVKDVLSAQPATP